MVRDDSRQPRLRRGTRNEIRARETRPRPQAEARPILHPRRTYGTSCKGRSPGSWINRPTRLPGETQWHRFVGVPSYSDGGRAGLSPASRFTRSCGHLCSRNNVPNDSAHGPPHQAPPGHAPCKIRSPWPSGRPDGASPQVSVHPQVLSDTPPLPGPGPAFLPEPAHPQASSRNSIPENRFVESIGSGIPGRR